MVDPSPLPVLLDALTARSPRRRTVALLHLAAHGPAAGEAAPEVARRFEDEDATVQWHAMRTFLAIGAGAAAAVPVLREQLDRSFADRMLRARVLAALAAVGPAAAAAAPGIAALLSDPQHGGDALQALVRVAPAGEHTFPALLDALFGSDYSRFGKAAEALRAADEALTARVLEAAAARLAGKDEEARRGAARILRTVAELRPNRALALARPLLDEADPQLVRPALSALERLGPAAAEAAPAVAAHLGSADARVVESACRALVALGTPLPSARGPLVELLGGERSPELTGVAAMALATVAPDAREAVAPLLAFLREQLTTPGRRGWYAGAAVARALGQLGRGAPKVPRALADAMDAAMARWEAEGSAVRNFLRGALEGLTALGPEATPALPALARRLADTDLREEIVPALRALRAIEREGGEATGGEGAIDDEGDEGDETAEGALPPLPEDEDPPPEA